MVIIAVIIGVVLFHVLGIVKVYFIVKLMGHMATEAKKQVMDSVFGPIEDGDPNE